MKALVKGQMGPQTIIELTIVAGVLLMIVFFWLRIKQFTP